MVVVVVAQGRVVILGLYELKIKKGKVASGGALVSICWGWGWAGTEGSLSFGKAGDGRRRNHH